jgi:hypothetical protein
MFPQTYVELSPWLYFSYAVASILVGCLAGFIAYIGLDNYSKRSILLLMAGLTTITTVALFYTVLIQKEEVHDSDAYS